jgi:murein DD-endopeptidase MepM/ murein hydrolase activator NlpD
MMSARGIVMQLCAAGLVLAACGNSAVVVEPVAPSAFPTTILPTGTRTPTSTPTTPSATTSPSPTPSPTSTFTGTPTPCNPMQADFCVDPAYFILQPPIAPPASDSVDRGYSFGSTEGGRWEPHHGVEFRAAAGTTVLAASPATVYFAGDDSVRKFSPWSDFYGNIVILEHHLRAAPFDVLYTLYAHLSQVEVQQGQAVSAGEEIGRVGMTGTAFGNHLHFELRVDPNDYDSTLNPELWLSPHPGNGALAFQFFNSKGKAIEHAHIKVQFIPVSSQPAVDTYYPEVYSLELAASLSPYHETAALGDLTSGPYRITVEFDGIFFERWVEISPQNLTRVAFIEKP